VSDSHRGMALTVFEAASRALGHVPIIDVNPRRDAALKEELALVSRCTKS